MSTPLTSFAHSGQVREAEQRAEQWALTVLRGTSFTDCLKINGLTSIIEVATAEGETLAIRGSDIYNNTTWNKFLESIKQAEPIYQLTDVGAQLAQHYQRWLLNEHTARYRAISTEAHLAWLERVVILAVTRHIMEQKYEAYTSQGKETFADPRVAIEMGNVLMLNHIAGEAARLVRHIIKEPAQARQLIEQFYDENARQMQARSLLMQQPRLPLAAGAALPFALQHQREEEAHE